MNDELDRLRRELRQIRKQMSALNEHKKRIEFRIGQIISVLKKRRSHGKR